MNRDDECHKAHKAEKGGSEGWGCNYERWMWKTSLIGWHLSQEPTNVQREHEGRAFCTEGTETGSQDRWSGSVSDLMVMSVEFQVMSLDQAIVEVAGRGCIIPAFWWHFVAQLNMCWECKIGVSMTPDLRHKQQKVRICRLLRWRNHMKVVGLFVRFIIIKNNNIKKIFLIVVSQLVLTNKGGKNHIMLPIVSNPWMAGRIAKTISTLVLFVMLLW